MARILAPLRGLMLLASSPECAWHVFHATNAPGMADAVPTPAGASLPLDLVRQALSISRERSEALYHTRTFDALFDLKEHIGRMAGRED